MSNGGTLRALYPGCINGARHAAALRLPSKPFRHHTALPLHVSAPARAHRNGRHQDTNRMRAGPCPISRTGEPYTAPWPAAAAALHQGDFNASCSLLNGHGVTPGSPDSIQPRPKRDRSRTRVAPLAVAFGYMPVRRLCCGAGNRSRRAGLQMSQTLEEGRVPGKSGGATSSGAASSVGSVGIALRPLTGS